MANIEIAATTGRKVLLDRLGTLTGNVPLSVNSPDGTALLNARWRSAGTR
jgi:hypothetical protein